jgi:hypothetical protein
MGMFSISIVIKHCYLSLVLAHNQDMTLLIFFVFKLLGENSGSSFWSTSQKRDKYNASMGWILLVMQLGLGEYFHKLFLLLFLFFAVLYQFTPFRYYLRFMDPKNSNALVDSAKKRYPFN